MNFFIVLLTLLIFLSCISNICIYYFVTKPEGKRGEKGNKGEKGIKGPPGNLGARGERGYEGNSGLKGPSQGMKGEKGDIGDIGPRGIKGENGFEGLKGYTGEKGPPGLQGFDGQPGKKGRVGGKGPPRIFSDNTDISLMAFKDKCITIKNDGNNPKFTCPLGSNMAVFDLKASSISNYSDVMKIEEVTCCKFGLNNPTLDAVYSRREFTKFVVVIATLKIKYNKIVENILKEEEADKDKKLTKEEERAKIILNNLEIINKVFTQTNLVNKEYLYITRLLHQLREDDMKLLEEIEKFPKNNIEELENYLKIK